MHFPNVPIIGQTATSIPAQLRLDAVELVGKILEEQKALGLKFGRVGIPSGIQKATAQFLLVLEALADAGCTIVAINEHIANEGHVMAAICFRCPDSLFTPKLNA